MTAHGASTTAHRPHHNSLLHKEMSHELPTAHETVGDTDLLAYEFKSLTACQFIVGDPPLYPPASAEGAGPLSRPASVRTHDLRHLHQKMSASISWRAE